MYLTNRRTNRKMYPILRKEKKYETLFKMISNVKSNPSPLVPEPAAAAATHKNESIVSMCMCINPSIIVVEPSAKRKIRPRSISKTNFEKFKWDNRFKLLVSKNESKLPILSEDIVAHILEYVGMTSNRNDYRLMKLGFHESEDKTQRQIQNYLINELRTSSDERFIHIIKYLNDRCCSNNQFTQKISKLFNRFLSEIMVILYEDDDESITKHYIHCEVEYHRDLTYYDEIHNDYYQSNAILYTYNIITELRNEPLHHFTRDLIVNLPIHDPFNTIQKILY